MKLHEYQAKRIFAAAGIPVPRGAVAGTPSDAASAYDELKRQCAQPATLTCQLKAQIHAGGRGKAGGIMVARSAQEASAQAQGLLGRRLETRQTGPGGLPVSTVLLEEQVGAARELYLAVTVERFHASVSVLASRWGGVDIEHAAASDPAAILRERVDVVDGPTEAALSRIVEALGLSGAQAQAGGRIARALWALFLSHDASLIEVNPLVVTDHGDLLALDAKVTLDDNALFRHPEWAAWRDESQEQPLELQAGRIGISYVGLQGNIGCLVNGAGLAMATNDIITLCGGSPANFLDVGGGANVGQVTGAFSILLSDSRVRAILVNIFGGIMRCDWIAQGLLNAAQQLEIKIPIVVRLQGTNVEEGRRLLAGARRLNLIGAEGLEEAARKAVELAGA